MTNDKIINLETFEVLDNEKYIIVDSLIADTIAILNKKGYKTKYCCSGHYYEPRKLLYKNCDISFLDEVKNDSLCEIHKINDKEFEYWSERNITDIYIMFAKKYEFSNIPKNFIKESDDTIRCTIEFFDNKNIRKKPFEIMEEIEKYNKILKDWANDLPEIK